ncbi:phospholipase effector Tle1 domain-containing protein [Stenotrophomonas sp. NPDC077421]|uniref:phospholipase effector Tle1 domain-containing protein n=1 Tax=Stenotrophomonas sp. NPDC077421 TaxID=3414699 RepID=UPI003C2C508F
MNEFAWLPGCAPATRLFNPCASGAGKTGASCSLPVRFSIFFDGTRNHSTEDRPSGSHSNVARLYDACTEQVEIGEFRLYIQGVGTPFPEIGEHEPHEHGARDGEYGDRRLRYAFMFMANKISELLCGKRVVSDNADAIIKAVESDHQIRRVRRTLDEVLANPKAAAPVISTITLDLFGFSRGATAARAFLNHLIEWAGEYRPQVCGIPLRVRFMGLFDTVASVEIADSMPRTGDGHLSWASPRYMVIPSFVEQCVHMVAGHEARNSFPLTTISASREQAPHRLEIIYPGVHADVGGGYGLTAQGKGTQKGGQRVRQLQGDLLSQISLNDMYERARAAAVPLTPPAELSQTAAGAFFAVSPELQRSYDAFQRTLEQHRAGAPLLRLLHAHYLAYLGWRRQVLPRETFIAQPFMTHCKQTQTQDHINLDQANAELMVYLAVFNDPAQRARVHGRRALGLPGFVHREHACMEMYDRYWGASPEPGDALRNILMQYVHDSRAGFVLTDPQCERDYRNMHAHLEACDAQYRESLRIHAVDTKDRQEAYQRAVEAHTHFVPTGWRETRPPMPKPPLVRAIPEDPLNAEDRKALATFRAGRTPIFTDAKPASAMDGKENVLDYIAKVSRREVRWSYLRRRQVFRPYVTTTGHPRIGIRTVDPSERLRYEDGLT